MKFDFFIFNVSLLAAIQTVNFASSVLRIPITSSIFLPSMKTLVSSANRIENNLSDTLGRSLMQIKKVEGLVIDSTFRDLWAYMYSLCMLLLLAPAPCSCSCSLLLVLLLLLLRAHHLSFNCPLITD